MNINRILLIAATAILFYGSTYPMFERDPQIARLREMENEMQDLFEREITWQHWDEINKQRNDLYGEAIEIESALSRVGSWRQKTLSKSFGLEIYQLYKQILEKLEAFEEQEEQKQEELEQEEEGEGEPEELWKLEDVVRQEAENEFLKAVNITELLKRYEFFMRKLRSKLSDEQMKIVQKDIVKEFQSRYKKLVKGKESKE